MVKADVDHRFDSQEDVCLMLKTWFPASEVISFRKLRGGYSGTNYLVEDQENHFYVIKICHGYNIDEVDTQVQLAAYLANHGYDKCCRPYALPSSDGIVRYVSKVADGEPMILLSYLPGKAGDVLIENHLLGSEDALRQVGYHLAQMHAVPLQSPHYEMLRHYLVDGICFLGRHIKHEYSQAFTTHGEEYIREHPFVKFYMHRYEAFLDCLHSCGQSRLSIVHGDPFLDNVLFTDQSPIKL